MNFLLYDQNHESGDNINENINLNSTALHNLHTIKSSLALIIICLQLEPVPLQLEHVPLKSPEMSYLMQ